jgi:hypothetical protein
MHGRVVRERRARDVQPRDGFAEVVIDRHEPQREDVPRGGRVVVARRRRRLGDASEARHRDASTDDVISTNARAVRYRVVASASRVSRSPIAPTRGGVSCEGTSRPCARGGK